MSDRIHFSEARQRTDCDSEHRDYGRVRVRINQGSNPREAYYDLNSGDGTSEPRLITADRTGRFFDENGHVAGTTYTLTTAEADELRNLINGSTVASSGTANADVCRQLSGVQSVPQAAPQSSNLTGWIAGPSLAASAFLGGCFLSPVVREVDGFAGSTNDILAGGVCGAGLAATAFNSWEAAAVSRGGHVVFDITQGSLLAASLVTIPLMDDPRPAVLTSLSLGTSILAGRLRRELSSPYVGDSVQAAAGVGMLVPGLMLFTQTPQPVPQASLYRMPGSTMHSEPPTPSPEERRFGLGLTLVGAFNLGVGVTSIIWHATHPNSNVSTARARSWSLFPMAAGNAAGASFQMTF